MRRCLSFDFFDYHEIVNNFENKRVVPYPDFNPDMQAFAAYQHRHPSWKPIIGDRLETSVKISDFVTAAEWQRTDLYNHIFRSRGKNTSWRLLR